MQAEEDAGDRTEKPGIVGKGEALDRAAIGIDWEK